MTLAKLKIAKITNKAATGNFQVSQAATDVFTVQFNPESFRLSKDNGWEFSKATGKDMPELVFTGGQPQSMDIQLTFDTTSTGDPVFEKYSVLRTLAKVDSTALNTTTGLGEPPWVMVQWGSYIGFAAVISGLAEEYTMFKPDGTPIRAKVTVSLRQVASDAQLAGQNPTSRTEPRKTWVVQQGQRLDWIAHMEYGDSSKWRRIAEANGIEDPLALTAGQVLLLPQ